MMKTPIFHLIDSLHAGGAERMAVNLSNGLLDSAYEVHLCVTRQLGAVNHLNPHVPFLYLGRKGRFDIGAFQKCLRYAQNHRIRLIHAHNTSVFFALLLRLFLPGVRVLWHIHGIETERLPWVKRMLYFWVVHRVDGLVCVSQDLLQWVYAIRPVFSKAWYLPNFITPALEPLDDVAAEGLMTGAPIVGSVANLKNPKDHPTLLTAWQSVLEKYPQAHLYLVGAIGEREYAENIIQQLKDPRLDGHITWLGARSDVPGLLQKWQIGVLSSRSEGFPVTLLEYGRAQLGVVCSNVGQCAEILDQGHAGILVPPGDAQAMANAIIHLIADPFHCRQLGEKLFQHADEKYSQKSVVAQLVDIYRQLLEDIPG